MVTIQEFTMNMPEETVKYLKDSLMFFSLYKKNHAKIQNHSNYFIDKSDKLCILCSLLLATQKNEELNLILQRSNYYVEKVIYERDFSRKKMESELRHNGVLQYVAAEVEDEDNKYKQILNDKYVIDDITLEHLFDSISKELLSNIDPSEYSRLRPFDLLDRYVHHYIDYGNKGVPYKSNLALEDECVICNMIDLTAKVYNTILDKYKKKDIIKKKEEQIPIEIRTKMLEEEETPELEASSPVEILSYGNELQLHSDFIGDEFVSLDKNIDNYDFSNLNEIYERVIKARNANSKRKFINKLLFGSKEVYPKINEDIVDDIMLAIDNVIEPLYKDVNNFYLMINYLGVYKTKIVEHLNNVDIKINELTEELDNTSKDDIINITRLHTFINALNVKKNSFLKSINLITQFICRLYLVMQNNLTTISSLEMSRDILLPLVKTELVISDSISNQKIGYQLTGEVVSLLNDIVNRNTDGIEETLNSIKLLNLPEDKLELVNNNLTEALRELTVSIGENESLEINSKKY